MRVALLLAGLAAVAWQASPRVPSAPDHIKLPPGFQIAVYADGVADAREMVIGTKGTVFVGSASPTRCTPCRTPTATIRPIGWSRLPAASPPRAASRSARRPLRRRSAASPRYDDIERKLDAPPKPVVVNDTFSDRAASRLEVHRLRPRRQALRAGRRAVQRLRRRTTALRDITRMNAGRQQASRSFARGVRNTRRLRLASGDEGALVHRQRPRHAGRRHAARRAEPRAAARAALRLSVLPAGDDRAIPSSATSKPCGEFAPPAQKLGPHVARDRHALLHRHDVSGGVPQPDLHRRARLVEPQHADRLPGDPGEARRRPGKVVATSRSPKGGCRATTAWGRPADVLVMPDGALLVSDDKAGAIYRITYSGH